MTRPPSAIPDDLAAAVTALRSSRGLGRPRLAALAGINGTTLFRIEAGQRGASREMLERLATALDASPSERDTLLTTAGFRPDDPTSLLADPDLTQLYAVLTDSRLTGEHRATLLRYVRLAVQHAQALGYATEDATGTATNGAQP